MRKAPKRQAATAASHTPGTMPPSSGTSPWYKDAIVYELHVRAFADSNGDGIGDFEGLVGKLDYLQDLGVTALWLLPFYPSPLRDGGYDISDYTGIDPAYGTRRDFARFLREAHARGLRVITELVLNHTSSEHPWFKRARAAPKGSAARRFYVWSDTEAKYEDARVIFKDFETSNWAWDAVAKAYYWHRFYAHQPDLNFDSPDVREAVLKVVDFWLGMGVDGLRLDAVPYLYEREGTSCENLPETHAFLRELRARVDASYPDRMLLAEANQWPADAAAYFGQGDECHMCFHFPVMPRLFMAVELEDSFPIINIMKQTPVIPESCQWATFLRNHDELTLEMVTDEDRDYMYRVYAEDPSARVNLGIRRRLGPLLKVRRRVELLNALLFSLPGTPVLYYGDEIGMGDNIYLGDRDGVRTPMQWSADRNGGFSRANPQKLYLPLIIDPEYHYEGVNVETQAANPSSLLWWMKRLIALRKQHKVMSRGALEILCPENKKVLAFLRSYGDETVLVVANLSRFAQAVELDLAAFEGRAPVELFGREPFPVVGPRPYFLSLGPYDFFWLGLERREPPEAARREPPSLAADGAWTSLLETPDGTRRLLGALLDHADESAWLSAPARRRRSAALEGLLSLGPPPEAPSLALVRVEPIDGAPETYAVPLVFAGRKRAAELSLASPRAVVARMAAREGDRTIDGALVDGSFAAELAAALLAGFGPHAAAPPSLAFSATRPAREAAQGEGLSGRLPTGDHENLLFDYGARLWLKVLRRVGDGALAELEMARYLTEKQTRRLAPALHGAIEQRRRGREPRTLALLYEAVPHVGTARAVARSAIARFFEAMLSSERLREPPLAQGPLTELARARPPEELAAQLGPFRQSAELLGRRTAELHETLARGRDAAFSPEPFTLGHQQSLFQSAQSALSRALGLLGRRRGKIPERLQPLAAAALGLEPAIEARLAPLLARRIDVARIRCHGDLRLENVLFLGDDFLFVDFAGERERPLEERRYKRCPLRDVACMVESLEEAAHDELRIGGKVRAEDAPRLEPWADAWAAWISAAYLGAYLDASTGAAFVPPRDDQRALLLDCYRVEKHALALTACLERDVPQLETPLRRLARLAAA